MQTQVQVSERTRPLNDYSFVPSCSLSSSLSSRSVMPRLICHVSPLTVIFARWWVGGGGCVCGWLWLCVGCVCVCVCPISVGWLCVCVPHICGVVVCVCTPYLWK